MSTLTTNPAFGFIGQMRDSGIAIDVAVKFHKFMRQQSDQQKTRKAVREVLQSIRKNYDAATH